MSPLVRRALVATLVVGALSITLFAAPAHAAGARDTQWQETASWSVWTVFSLDYWMDFAGSLVGVDLGRDEAVAGSPPEQMGSVFDRQSFSGEPNGIFATGLVNPYDPDTLTDGQN